MSERISHISEEYEAHLSGDYGTDLAATIARGWEAAPLPEQPGQTIQYIRLAEAAPTTEQRPVLFVPGFSGGIVANAPLGAALAHRGFEVILPDQNRVGMLRNPAGKRDATYTQVQNLAAVISYEKLTQTPLDVVTHSYGSLQFDALSEYAQQQGWRCFEGSKVAMLAPAGIVQDETTVKFLKRYVQLFRNGSSIEKFSDGYAAQEQEMFAAGQAMVTANIPRALREGWRVIHDKVELRAIIKRGIGTMALVPFAEDALYGQDTLTASLPVLLSDNVVALSAVSLASYDGGQTIRGSRGSDHPDQQFNPERVAGMLDNFLRV